MKYIEWSTYPGLAAEAARGQTWGGQRQQEKRPLLDARELSFGKAYLSTAVADI